MAPQMVAELNLSEKKARETELQKVVEVYRSSLLPFIRSRVRDQIEADDVLQDVFEEYIEAYDVGVVIERLGAWLIRVAQNKILDRFRRMKTRERYASQKFDDTERAGPEQEFSQSVVREELLAAIEALPEDQRLVFVANELEGKTFEQLAAETGIPLNTLLSRKRYAVMNLRDHLKEIYDELE